MKTLTKSDRAIFQIQLLRAGIFEDIDRLFLMHHDRKSDTKGDPLYDGSDYLKGVVYLTQAFNYFYKSLGVNSESSLDVIWQDNQRC